MRNVQSGQGCLSDLALQVSPYRCWVCWVCAIHTGLTCTVLMAAQVSVLGRQQDIPDDYVVIQQGHEGSDDSDSDVDVDVRKRTHTH